MSWGIARSSGRRGTGNWDAYDGDLQQVWEACDRWRSMLAGKDRLWLCWNISDRWSLLQQRMVLAAGWTPVVGFDPNCRPRHLATVDGAVLIDFNESFGFDALWPHFPLEFSFRWAPGKLAFWHADLLVREPTFFDIAKRFEQLADGDMSAVYSHEGLRHLLNRRRHRYWELIGCTTPGASRHQFEHGCGWWRHFYKHPNTPPDEREARAKYYYDSGVGIAYWARRYRRRVVNVPERLVSEGHCSEIGSTSYVKSKHKGVELDMNFDFETEVARMGLQKYADGG